MALLPRLCGLEFPRLDIHAFQAFTGEFDRGETTAQEMSTALELSPAEQAELIAILAKIITPAESISLGGYSVFANIGTVYRVLAVTRIQASGITGFEFGCVVSKIGTGTQSWQLWDATNSNQIVVFDDAGAAATERILGPTEATFAPLPKGMRTFQVRGKSTNAADDPIFHGASLAVTRVGTMTADTLHQVLLEGNFCVGHNVPPLNTLEAIEARLGL